MSRSQPTNDTQRTATFAGFAQPTANWFRLPEEWIDIAAEIKNLAELKVVQYILRHTWGYQEYGIKKHITVDEFVLGRKRRDGSRMDKGTGLAEQSVRNGLAAAVAHGWIEEVIDATDKARIKKFYGLRMQGATVDAADDDPHSIGDHPHDLESEVQTLDPEVQDVDLRGPSIRPRTENELSNEPFELGDSMVSRSMAQSLPARGPTFAGDDSRETNTNRGLATSPPIARVWPPAAHPATETPHPRGEPAGRSAVPGLSRIAVTISEISDKLGDRAHYGSNQAQAMNLFILAGGSEDRFVQVLFEASAITRDELQRRRMADGEPIGKPMAYFFRVVRDLLGLDRAHDAPPRAPARRGREKAP